jgi:integrase
MLDSIERRSRFVFIYTEIGDRLKNITRVFESALKRARFTAGREKGLTFHDLRHIAAYRLCKLTDIVTASKILCHSS